MPPDSIYIVIVVCSGAISIDTVGARSKAKAYEFSSPIHHIMMIIHTHNSNWLIGTVSVGVDSLSPTRGTSTLCCILCIAKPLKRALPFRAYVSLYSSRNICLRTSLRALSKELATLRSHRPSLTLSRGYTNIVAGFTPRDEFIV